MSLLDDLLVIRDQMRRNTGRELLISVPVWVSPASFARLQADGAITPEGRLTETGRSRLGDAIAAQFRCKVFEPSDVHKLKHAVTEEP